MEKTKRYFHNQSALIMIKKLVFFTSLVFLFGSCNWLDFSNDDKPERPYLWKTKIRDPKAEGSLTSLDANMVYNNQVLVTGRLEDNSALFYLLDCKDGHIVWSWNDFLDPTIDPVFSAYNSCIYQNFFRFHTGDRHHCIDLNTGQTVWKERTIACQTRYQQSGDSMFMQAYQIDSFPGYEYNACFLARFDSPIMTPLFYPPLQFDTLGELNTIGTIWAARPVTINGHFYYVTIYGITYPNWFYAPKLALFDPSINDYVYHSVWTVQPEINRVCTNFNVVGDKVYFSAGNKIVCHDILSGVQVWDKQFPLDFQFSGFVIHEGKLIANCENNVLYCLDIETGNTIWEGEGAGTSSTIEDKILNGVLYFKGGATGFLHAVDVNTGETLMKLNHDDYTDPGQRWMSQCYVVPGVDGKKGCVVVRSQTHVFCFEAIR